MLLVESWRGGEGKPKSSDISDLSHKVEYCSENIFYSFNNVEDCSENISDLSNNIEDCSENMDGNTRSDNLVTGIEEKSVVNAKQ